MNALLLLVERKNTPTHTRKKGANDVVSNVGNVFPCGCSVHLVIFRTVIVVFIYNRTI
jgi:hypothetical protein